MPTALCSLTVLCACIAPLLGGEAHAQVVDTTFFGTMEYRLVGPFRGGRSTAVTGVAGKPYTFYMGTTGGGVWQTTDAGTTWTNISDGFIDIPSIGAVDVADSDPNVIYVGTGSAGIRGNISTGRGAYRSTDAGRTWSFIGLAEAGLIGRIAVHPSDPDLVYAAALGRPFGKNPERGVYRSSDGGDTWDHVLALNDSVGAVDLSMNPHNPREIYAAMWRAERKPWTLIDASHDGGVYKTSDGGDTWTKLAGGLPEGLTGRIGVTVSPANPDRVWALVSAHDPDGGIYRSDDAGRTWQRVNRDRRLRQRHWYYSHVIADPADENTVYAMNTGLYRSVDGGAEFESISVPHGDVHDLWVNPTNANLMVVGNDGGAQVSVTAGESWSTPLNQPTAELYRVTVDNQFPYRLYSGQQDNSTISIPSWSAGGITPQQHWYSVGGCESGHVAVDPRNPNLAYAGCYIGEITRYDHGTSDLKNVMVYPALVDGIAPKDLTYRFQWNAPIVISPHDPDILYHTSNHVHRTRDGGMNWDVISPDLTTNDSTKQHFPGGPLQQDHTSVEVYTTVFAFVESPHTRGTLWAGSDDGLVHISRDDGTTWTNITPPGIPADATVNTIELSAHQAGRAFLAVHRYRMDDYAPYVYRTNDYGRSWDRLTGGDNGIPDDHPVRVVREDPDRQGLLYAGTEFGMFVSFNDGEHWQPFQLNLPRTPITDLQVHERDLVVATQGRSLWILDDLTPLHQIEDAQAGEAYLYAPRDTYRARRGGFRSANAPEAPPNGAVLRYYLADDTDDTVRIQIRTSTGEAVRTFSSASGSEDATLPMHQGINRFVWDLQHDGLERPDGAMVYLGYSGGPVAVPGDYEVHMAVGERMQTQSLRIRPDPRLPQVTQDDLEEQFRLATQIRDAQAEIYESITLLRDVRTQTQSVATRAEEAGFGEDLQEQADTIEARLTTIEGDLINTKSESNQDPINFPPMLDNQMGYLYRQVIRAYSRPTKASYDRFEELLLQVRDLGARVRLVLDTDVAELNRILLDRGVPGVVVQQTKQRLTGGA